MIRGDKVYFGRTHGEKTLGEVIKVNGKSVKVKQLEQRGTMKNFAVGTIWRVALSLVSPATGEASSPTPAPKSKRPEGFILVDIALCYVDLSDEHLVGALAPSRADAARKSVQLNQKLLSLFEEIGREVSREEAIKNSADFPPAAPVPAPAARTEAAILKDILGVYGNLSPENLSCDGELSRTRVRQRAAQLNRQLRQLFQEIGRTVSEDEAYRTAYPKG
jgi:hypothetical protein